MESDIIRICIADNNKKVKQMSLNLRFTNKFARWRHTCRSALSSIALSVQGFISGPAAAKVVLA